MRSLIRALLAVSTLAVFATPASLAQDDPIRIGSKTFTESYILGEIAAQLLESEGFAVERQLGLGGTLVAFEALALGLPVVVADDHGCGEWLARLGSGGRAVPPGDPSALAGAIGELLADPAAAIGSSLAAELDALFAPTRIAAALESVYAEVLG